MKLNILFRDNLILFALSAKRNVQIFFQAAVCVLLVMVSGFNKKIIDCLDVPLLKPGELVQKHITKNPLKEIVCRMKCCTNVQYA